MENKTSKAFLNFCMLKLISSTFLDFNSSRISLRSEKLGDANLYT